MKKFSKLLAVVVAIAVVVCPMMSIVSNATSTGGYKIEALDENNLKLTISSTDGFIAYSASVGFNSASAFQSTYSSDGYTNGVKLIDYTTKTAAKSSYNTPQISANATGSALNVVVMPSDINNLDLLTEVVIGLRVASGTTASLTKIQAADDGAEITEDPTLLSFPAADANTGAIDSTDPAYISSNATTNAHTHSFTQQTQTAAYLRTAATCSANATYWYSCATCGLASSTNYFTATGTMLAHTPDNTETFVKAAATCTEDAQYWQECSVCHQQLSTYWTKPSTASGHSMTYHEATASTCVYQGNDAYYSCSRCGKLFGDNAGANEVTIEGVTRALGDHTASNTKKFLKTAADCTNDAVYYQECSVCGTQLVSTWTDTGSATGHSFGEYVADGNATCETDGTKTRTCSACGATETVTDTGSHSSVAHTPAAAVTENTVAATCSATGSYDSVVYCSVCGAEISRTPNVIAKLAHTVVEDAAVAATCTATGLTAGSHCSVCNEVIVAQTVVPATGHTAVEDAAVAATCTETGLTAGSHCSVCGETIVAQTVVPALGHDFTYNSNSNGTHAVGCTRCDYAATEDCDTAGAEGACSKCGYKAAVAVCEHAHVEFVSATPTHDAGVTGTIRLHCLDCDETIDQDLIYQSTLRFRYPALELKSEIIYALQGRQSEVGGYDAGFVVSTQTHTFTDVPTVTINDLIADRTVGVKQSTYDTWRFDVKIASTTMSDTIVTEIYALKDGVWYCGRQNSNSVKNFIESNFAGQNDKMKTLFVDLLNYGAAAQTYFGKATDNLPNKDLTSAQLECGSTTVDPAVSIKDGGTREAGVLGKSVGVSQHGLTLSSKIPLDYTLHTTNYANLGKEISDLTAIVTYTDNYGADHEVQYKLEGYEGPEQETMTYTKANRYTFTFTDFSASHIRTAFTLNVVCSEGQVLETYTYSVASFIADNPTSDSNLQALYDALLKYGDACRAAFAS